MTPFWRRLLLIAVLALAFRVVDIAIEKSDVDAQGDAIYYAAQAQAISDGEWFRHPHHPREAADHPPLTSLALAPVTVVWDHSLVAQRYTMAVFGVGVVVLVGLLARRVWGDRAGLIAAGIVAVYPAFWLNDVVTMSETLTAAGVAATLLGILWFRDRPSVRRAAVVGALIGITAMARAETGLLLPLGLVPVALLVRTASWRARLGWIGAAAAASVASLVPWTAYNLSRFDEPVLVSHNDGLTLVGTNCEEAYNGSSTGYWLIQCLPDGAFTDDQTRDQSAVSSEYRKIAREYATDHLGDLPRVALVRLGLGWSAWDPAGMVEYTEFEDREAWASWVGLAMYWVLVPVAVAGGVMLWRRDRTALVPLGATVVMVTLTSMLFYGHVRFRVPAEVTIVVLAAGAIAAWTRRARPGPTLVDS